jgi:hypothetical protein
MKTKIAFLGLVVILTFTSILSLTYRLAYRKGYDLGHYRGIQDERRCWKIEPASSFSHGVITARRDMSKHPFSRAVVVTKAVGHDVNSIPVIEFPPHAP